jgi:hypothetical protein
MRELTHTAETGRNTYNDVLGSDSRSSILDNDGRAANPSTVTCDVHRTVMIVDVDAHEFADAARTSKLPELLYETGRIFRQANDRTVHVHNKSVGAIYLCACRQADIYKSNIGDVSNISTEPLSISTDLPRPT